MPAMLRFILLYVTLYAAFGVASPFWPKFLETRSFGPGQIGLVLGAAMLLRLVTGPLIGMLADLLRSLRFVLASCAVVSAIAGIFLIWAGPVWLLFALALLQAGALAPTTSLADSLSVNVAGLSVAGKDGYGWIRGAASAAFVMGTLSAGQLISPSDLSPVIWLNAALLIASAGATAIVPHRDSRTTTELRTFPIAEMKALFGIARFRMLILVSALVYGSHAVHDAFAVIRWSDAGIGPSTISFLWSEAVIAEVFVFFIAGPALIDRFGCRGAAVLAAAAGVIRWSTASMTTSVLVLALIQPLHGLTFALLHLACMQIMGTLVKTPIAATAQTIYAFGSGLVTAALTVLSGILYASHANAAFLLMGLLCLVALPFAWFGFVEDD